MPPDDPRPPDNFVTLAQAIAATGKSERTLRRWIASGRLPTKHEKGRMLVNLADIATAEPATEQAQPVTPDPPGSAADSIRECHARIKELEADVTRLAELLTEVRGERDYLRQLHAMTEARLIEAESKPARRGWVWPWSKNE